MPTPPKINVTLTRNGDYWLARWFEPSGRRRGKSLGRIDGNNRDGGMSHGRAMLECAKLENELNTHSQWVQRANPTVKYIAEDWLNNRDGNISETTLKNYRDAVIGTMLESLGELTKAAAVTPEDALRYRAKLQRKLKNNTAARHFRIAKSVFTRAQKQRFIEYNPFDLVDSPPDNVKVEYPYVHPHQFELIMECEPDPEWRAYWAMLRYAGMRANEPLRLRWQHINFGTKRIHVPGNDDGRVTTKKRPRMIPLVPELESHLLRWHVFAESGYNDTPLLTDIHRLSVNKRWRKLLDRSGLALDCTPQALRVSRENDWMQRFPSPEVAAWMGHTVQTQMKNYHNPLSPVSQRTMDEATKPHDTNTGTKMFPVSENISE
jgi:integrase